jgi:hypothetical protein
LQAYTQEFYAQLRSGGSATNDAHCVEGA